VIDSPRKDEQYNLYIIGNKGMYNELFLHFFEHSTNTTFNCSLHNSFALLDIEKTKSKKNLVLCNCRDAGEFDQSTNACGRHLASAPADCYWVCVNVPHDRKIEESAVSNGVHGIFYEDDSLAILTKGIAAILNGELWFSRDTLSATVSSLVDKNNTYKSSLGGSDKIGLTRREKEILKLIALGKSNEEISEKLCISTLTVKTHVSNIYRKTNVPNRIQAIFWATKNFVHLKD